MHLILVPGTLAQAGQRYFATIADTGEIVATSRQPFYAAARALQQAGYDDEIVLTASHAGEAGIAMRSTIGVAAGWSVIEGERAGLSRIEFQERPAAIRVAPPAADSTPDPVYCYPGSAARVFEHCANEARAISVRYMGDDEAAE